MVTAAWSRKTKQHRNGPRAVCSAASRNRIPEPAQESLGGQVVVRFQAFHLDFAIKPGDRIYPPAAEHLTSAKAMPDPVALTGDVSWYSQLLSKCSTPTGHL